MYVFLKIQFDSRNITKYNWISDWVTLVPLSVKKGWFGFSSLRRKLTSCAFLLMSGLKLLFHWNAYPVGYFPQGIILVNSRLVYIIHNWKKQSDITYYIYIIYMCVYLSTGIKSASFNKQYGNWKGP